MAHKRTTKKPAPKTASAKRSKPSATPGTIDTADIAEQYSREDQEREEQADTALPAIDDADEMTTGTVQDQLVYQGLEENRAGSADLKRAEKARDALADRTAAASNPGSGASKRVAARSAKPSKPSKSSKAPKGKSARR